MDILRIHSRKMNLTRGINLRKIAEKMTGASGAESKVRDLLSTQLFSMVNSRVYVQKPVCMLLESEEFT